MLETTADYRHGVDMAACAVLRFLRALDISDDDWLAVAKVIAEVRETRPLYGAQPEFTGPEVEVAARKWREFLESRHTSAPITA